MKHSNLSEQEIIAKVKREFEDYKFYNKLKIGWTLRITELEARIIATGGSLAKMPDSNERSDLNKNNPLVAEVEELKRRIEMNKKYLKPIDDFKKTLTIEERFILDKRYFDKDIWTFEQIRIHLNMGINTAKRILEYVCLNYWYSAH